jgi:hypothetical protein
MDHLHQVNMTYLWTTMDGSSSQPANTAIVEATAKGTYQLLVTNSIQDVKIRPAYWLLLMQVFLMLSRSDQTLTCNDAQFTLGSPNTSTE